MTDRLTMTLIILMVLGLMMAVYIRVEPEPIEFDPIECDYVELSGLVCE